MGSGLMAKQWVPWSPVGDKNWAEITCINDVSKGEFRYMCIREEAVKLCDEPWFKAGTIVRRPFLSPHWEIVNGDN